MGQAKRRGSYEQRKESSIQKILDKKIKLKLLEDNFQFNTPIFYKMTKRIVDLNRRKRSKDVSNILEILIRSMFPLGGY
jgi:hypothetical protein